MSAFRLLLVNLRVRWREWWQPTAPDLVQRYQAVWQADVRREGR